MRGNEIVFVKTVEGQQRVFTSLAGFGSTAKDYDITVENKNADVGVTLTSDKPLSKLIFWSRPRTENWETRYIFYTLEEDSPSREKKGY